MAIQPLPEFNPDFKVGAILGARWNHWIEVLKCISSQTTARSRALLLYQAGHRVREIFRRIPETGDDSDMLQRKRN